MCNTLELRAATLPMPTGAQSFRWLERVPDVESRHGILEVLKSPRRVLEVRRALDSGEGAAECIERIRHREIALVALLVDGEPMALGELSFQLRVETGFDAQFRELLRSTGLFSRMRTNCSPRDWDQLMDDVDRNVIAVVNDYDACAPSWIELCEKFNAPPRPEFRQMFKQAEPVIRQHLLNAWAVVALQAVQPCFTRWSLGPRVAVGLGSALAVNNTAQHLDMSGRSISDEGVRAFAKALHWNTTLTVLALAHNDLDDTAAKLLAAAVAVNRGLLQLSLAHNKITQAGALWLAKKGLGCNASLQQLDLRGHDFPAWVGELDKRILV